MSFLTKLYLIVIALIILFLFCIPVHAQLAPQEQQLASLIIKQRPILKVHPTLSKVARAKAYDMAKRGYFGHVDPDGHGANYLVRRAGYRLPDQYSKLPSGNDIESAGAACATAYEVWSAFMASPPHRMHLMGSYGFSIQTNLGVGYCYDPKSIYKHYWVVLIAPPPPPALSLTTPKINSHSKNLYVTVAGASSGFPKASRIQVDLRNLDANTIETKIIAGAPYWYTKFYNPPTGNYLATVSSFSANGNLLKTISRKFYRTEPPPESFIVLKGRYMQNGKRVAIQFQVGANRNFTGNLWFEGERTGFKGKFDETRQTFVLNKDLSINAYISNSSGPKIDGQIVFKSGIVWNFTARK